MSELAFRSVSENAQAIRSGQLSAVELLQLYLGRIAELNESINAVVTIDAQSALDQAHLCDEAVKRNESLGPLHGIPMTIKDSIETRGMRTTSGSPDLVDHVPDTDASVVARLRKAGAVIFGKTNLPLFAGDCQSYNEVFGTTNNPWDVTRGPGGSSGGAAAAVSAGLTSADIGSDQAGSIRNPAHFCGVYGIKPTFGVAPTDGHIPPGPGALTQVDIGMFGPITRSATDLDLLLQVIAGPTELDSRAWTITLPASDKSSLNDFRVAVWMDEPMCEVDSAVRDVLQSAVEAVRTAGCLVDETARPDVTFVDLLEVHQAMLGAAFSGWMPDEMLAEAHQGLSAGTGDPKSSQMRWWRSLAMPHHDWMKENEKRQRNRLAFERFFGRFDVLLTPVMPVAAFPHDHSAGPRTLITNGREVDYADASWWNAIFGSHHLPAVSAPVGLTRDGLPVGIHIVAPFLKDRTAIRFAELLAGVTPGFQVPPGFE